MKNLVSAFICAGSILCMSCESGSDILPEYESALENCKPDTILMYGKEDTIEFYQKPVECILGARLPNFNATSMDSVQIDSSYFAGKVSVLNFWFIGCHPCEEEMPGFNKLVEKYKSQPVQFLSISRNSPTHIREFLLERPFNFDHIAYGEPIIVDDFKAKWGYPVTIIADKHMKIIYASSGGKADSTAVEIIQRELTPVINKALKEI